MLEASTTARKAGLRSSVFGDAAGVAAAGRGPLERRQRQRRNHDDRERRHDQPDQMAGRHALQQEPGADIAGDEGDRAPQAHRPVVAVPRAEPDSA